MWWMANRRLSDHLTTMKMWVVLGMPVTPLGMAGTMNPVKIDHSFSADIAISSLTAAQKQPMQQSEALMKAISLAVDSKPEEHHGCISHRCALIFTTPDQHQIATFSKSSATAQLLQSGPSVDTRPFLLINKHTSSQWKVHRQNNQVVMWATKKRPPLPKRVWCQVKRRMLITLLVGQSKWWW